MVPGLVVTALVAVFGIFFAMQARSMGAPFIFVIFGIGFTIVAVSAFISTAAGIAQGSERDSSLDEDAEPAVLYRPDTTPNEREFAPQQTRECAYCGTRVVDGENRCPNCGAGV
ncbi:MAG: zinc ribbon domain-containing protein [Candidatus Hydrogenedentes bacterium]|nr:zinc ribbon domain-containing protein [Candidatus Hydrogenedentota bacterium]